MESDKVIGSKLSQIQKKPDEVKLLFENPKTGKRYTLTFNGILFETSGTTLNRVVKSIRFDSTVGFRANSELRNLNENPEKYAQISIQMEGSDESIKRELLGAFRSYKMASTPARTVRNSTRSSATSRKRGIAKK